MTETEKPRGPTPGQLVGTWYRAGTEPDPNHRIGRDPNHLMFHLMDGELYSERIRRRQHDKWSRRPRRRRGLPHLSQRPDTRTSESGPSPAEALTITTVKLAVQVSLDEGALLFTTARARLAPSTNMRQPPLREGTWTCSVAMRAGTVWSNPVTTT